MQKLPSSGNDRNYGKQRVKECNLFMVVDNSYNWFAIEELVP